MFDSKEFVRYLAASLDGVACCPLDTTQIIAALESLGLTPDPEIHPEASRSGHERRQNPTSPEDMSWWKNDSCIALAWDGGMNKPGSVLRDFEKLILANASWKLLITGGSNSEPQSLRPTLEGKLKEHDGHRTCEIYVWIDFSCNPEGCALRGFEFVPEADGPQNDPVFAQVSEESFRFRSGTFAPSDRVLKTTVEQQFALISEIIRLQARSIQFAELLKIVPAEQRAKINLEMQLLFLREQTLRLRYQRLIDPTAIPESSKESNKRRIYHKFSATPPRDLDLTDGGSK